MLESQSETVGLFKSEQGVTFGLEGFSWGSPVPTSITFFLDNTALVADQYGRPIRTALLDDGSAVKFADCPPLANRQNEVEPRPQFATHAQTIAALASERVDWLAYTVKYKLANGGVRARAGLTKAQADAAVAKLVKEGNTTIRMDRSISAAGWPQLEYDELMALPELPPTPEDELRKILDPNLRRDALRARAEADGTENENAD